MKMKLKVLTLNCWGIVGVSKNRKIRMNAIANELCLMKHDFVFLQEVWAEKDYNLIALKIKINYPYSHFFHSGVIGGGICIFSKSPIIEAFFHSWPINGYIHKIHHGDWFGGKGVGICTVNHNGLIVNLYVTHLHAEYNQENDEYKAHRILQAYETSQLINYTKQKADVCILGGDLNTDPASLPYKIIKFNTGLVDAFHSVGKPEEDGMTSETPFNSYTMVGSLKNFPHGRRIDYIMYCSEKYHVKTLDCCNPLPSRVKNHHFSYSDHEAVSATLEVTNPTAYKRKEESCLDTLKESLDTLKTALNKLSSNSRKYFLAFMLILMLVLVLSHSIGPSGAALSFLVTLIYTILTLVGGYCLIMATIWTRIERAAILSGILAITIRLEYLSSMQ